MGRRTKLIDRACNVAKRIQFPRMQFQVGTSSRKVWVRVHCPNGTCNVTGQPMAWNGRKWLLSPHMTETEIVLTFFKALLTAYEHEARELFKVDGVAVLDSHYSIDDMVRFAKTASLDGRS
jgi:hypothetical protein